MPGIDPNQCLSKELRIESVANTVHNTGLHLFSKETKSYPKRKLFYTPIIIIAVFAVFTSKEVIIILLNEDNDRIFKILGSFGHLVGIRKEFSILFILLSIQAISIEFIYYYNYSKGTEPTFLRVFEMMSGSITPKSVGLTNEKQIRRLLRITGIVLKCVKFHNTRIRPVFSFAFVITVYSVNTDLNETLGFGIPNAIFVIIWNSHLANFMIYPFVIFFILCLYLKWKIKAFNEIVSEMKKRKGTHRFFKVKEMVDLFCALDREVNQYNETYWSKILFSFWYNLGSIAVFLLYTILYGELTPVNESVLIYSLLLFGSMFLSLIFMASSVDYWGKKSYSSLHSVLIAISQSHPGLNIGLVKVNFLIERVADRRIGFAVWKLFKINYFSCYEVSDLY